MKTLAILAALCAAAAHVAPARAGEISSVYTSLDLEKCDLVSSSPNEGGWAQWWCEGLNGMTVRVAEGDLRFFVSFGPNAGQQVAATQTLGPFNTIHHTLEWRVENKGGTLVPFATILRYVWEVDDRKGQTLVVTRLDGEEACQAAHVRADGNPDANAEARRAADASRAGFDCRTSELDSYLSR